VSATFRYKYKNLTFYKYQFHFSVGRTLLDASLFTGICSVQRGSL